MKENLSIITDFGCPFSCSFCITKSQKKIKEFIFNEKTFDILKNLIQIENIKRISISGGGEPLYTHSLEILKFYEGLFNFCKENKICIHVHTNLNYPNKLASYFDKVAISLNDKNYKDKIKAWENISVKRFVFVSNGEDLNILKEIIFLSGENQVTIKQLDSVFSNKFEEIKEYIKIFKNVKFLPTGDYNTYFNLNDLKIYDKFFDIKFK